MVEAVVVLELVGQPLAEQIGVERLGEHRKRAQIVGQVEEAGGDERRHRAADGFDDRGCAFDAGEAVLEMIVGDHRPDLLQAGAEAAHRRDRRLGGDIGEAPIVQQQRERAGHALIVVDHQDQRPLAGAVRRRLVLGVGAVHHGFGGTGKKGYAGTARAEPNLRNSEGKRSLMLGSGLSGLGLRHAGELTSLRRRRL